MKTGFVATLLKTTVFMPWMKQIFAFNVSNRRKQTSTAFKPWKFINWVKTHVTELVLFLIIALHISLLLHLIFFPYPELFVYSFLSSKGLLPYRDIFDQHFPGIMLFPINLYSLGLATFARIRVVHLLLVALNQILLYKIGCRITNSNKKALLMNFFYLLWQPYFEGNVLWIESFVTPLLLFSYYFLDANCRKRLFISGLLMGLALVFKQVVFPLILFVVVYLFVKNSKKMFLVYLFGLSIFPILMIMFVFSKGIFGEFLYWTATFNLTVFSQMGRKDPNLAGLIQAAPLFALGFLSAFFVLVKFGKKYLPLLLFAAATLFFAYARYDFIHLQPSLPFFICLITLSLFSINRRLLVIFIIVYITLASFFIIRFYKLNFGSTIVFWGETEKLVTTIVKENTNPDDKIFSYGSIPDIYFLTNRLPPGNKFVFQFPWFMKVAEKDILKGIIQDSPQIVVEEEGVYVQGYNLDDYMQNIRMYLGTNYVQIGKVGEIKILKKL